MKKYILYLALLSLVLLSCDRAEYPRPTYQGLRMAQYSSAVINHALLSTSLALTVDSLEDAPEGIYFGADYAGNTGGLRMPGGEMVVKFPRDIFTIADLTRLCTYTVQCVDGNHFRVVAAYPSTEQTYQPLDSLVLDFNVEQIEPAQDNDCFYYRYTDVVGKGEFGYTHSGYAGRIKFGVDIPLAANSAVDTAYSQEYIYYAPVQRMSPAPYREGLISGMVSFVSGGLLIEALNDDGETRNAKVEYLGDDEIMVWFNSTSDTWNIRSDIY